jgi:hypothetical protein
MGLSLFLSALLMAGSAQAALPSPVGSYRLVGEQDVASALVLHADGRFEYFLAAGALDERSKGRWTAEGANLRLETVPKPVPPAFSLASTASTSDAPLTVKVVWPDGRGIAGVDVRVGFDEGSPIEGYTQEGGWSLSTGEKRPAKWIELEVPMHQLRSQRFQIKATEGNALSFVLTPNDLGLVDFSNLLLEHHSGKLVMHRSGAELTYARTAD